MTTTQNESITFNGVCEDAPCCGCCGTSLYGSETRYEPEFDPYDDDFYEGDEPECDDEHECDSCDGPSGIWTKEGVFTPHEGAHWRCSWCDRPCPEGAHAD